ncbi:MAG TPA: hypothetical protein DCO79_13745 [Spirochaeta sp.]|nr:hypothetical protein [Spirochaeta sp.]
MKKTVFAIFFATAVFLSCGNTPPELKQIYSEINFLNIPGSENVRSEMLVLVNADDEDGDDDITGIHIINDSEQMSWDLDSSIWKTRDSRGMKWTGSQRLTTVDGSMPKAGEYRVLVVDRAGERVEESVFFPLIKNPPSPADFAELIFQDEQAIELKSPQERNIISFYDSEGKLLGAYAATPGLIRINKLRDGSAVAEKYSTVKVSYYSNLIGAGLISGFYEKP